MKSNIFCIAVTLFSLLIVSCTPSKTKQEEVRLNEHNCETSCKSKDVMTKQKQVEFTPDEVLNDLLEGNKRYISNTMKNRDFQAQVKATTEEQFPKAVILACIDSRVPVEYIFDQGVGDIFVARVAGNIEDEALLGSMEYGLGVAGSKLLMVLGHENCGAVKSAIKEVDVGSKNVDALLNHIESAIQEIGGTRDASDKEYFNEVVKNNVHQTVEDIRSRSEIIRNLEKEGKVKVVGAYYSLTDGKVTVLGEDKHAN